MPRATAKTAADLVLPADERRHGIHILFCATPDYFQHVAVAAVSLVLSSGGTRPLCIHVMTCNPDGVAEARLRETFRPFGHVQVIVHPVDGNRLDPLFVDGHVTRETYLRLLAPEVLPATIERLIYLDSDLVVLDDIAGLYDVDLRGASVGAVLDGGWSIAAPERLRALGISPESYVNAGVLVLDLAKWRRECLAERVLAFAAVKGSALVRHDQDALNAVLAHDIQLINRRWNLQTLMLGHWVRSAMPDEFRATEQARRSPGIIHYSTDQKPWKYRAWTRRRRLYFHYLSKTSWRYDFPKALNAPQMFEYFLSKQLLSLRIDLNLAGQLIRRLEMVFGRSSVAKEPAPAAQAGKR